MGGGYSPWGIGEKPRDEETVRKEAEETRLYRDADGPWDEDNPVPAVPPQQDDPAKPGYDDGLY